MRLFKSIQGKLAALLALFFVVQCVVLFGIGWELSSVSDRYRGVIEDDLQQKARVDILNIEFKTQVQEWKNVLLRGHEQKDFDKYWGRFTQQQQKIQVMSKEMAGLEADSAIRAKVQGFTAVHQSVFAKYQQGKEVFAFQAADHKAADQVVRGIDREPSNLLKAASALINQRALNRTQELNSLSATLTTSVYWLVIFMSVIACVVLTLLVRGLLVKPVLSLQEHAYEMASGDFSHEIRVGRGDEIGALSKALNKMRSELCVMLTSMSAASNQLSGSSGALSSAAQRIDDDTHHAQDHAGQIAAAMTQMSASIAEVASNAAIAADATDVANQGAGDGMRVMEEAIGAITAVADEVVKISADMIRLEQDTTSVGAVLDVIKGIAEQTNLLALNAAIEAARAGEQGRGFAVVADEVRALAKRTQESTEEIHHIIEAVQNGAKAAAGGMDAGSQKTEHAVSLAREAGEAIRKIVSEIDRVQGMSSQIATAAEEQAAATEEINRNVVNMTALSEKAHESAANAHDVAQGLSEIASGLHGTAGKFKLPH